MRRYIRDGVTEVASHTLLSDAKSWFVGANIPGKARTLLDETSDVGMKRGSPITLDLPAGSNAFTGTVQLIVIEAAPKQEVNHLISREQFLHMLLARQ